jgi:urease subunit alpha
MFGSYGSVPAATSVLFTSQAAIADGSLSHLGLNKRLVPVQGCRTVSKADMVHNSATPRIDVDPETYEVRADGQLLTCEPAEELPMAQRYFLF